MNKLLTLLNKEVANFGVLYTKLHNFHWFVKGRQFYVLHGKFEELYDEVTEHFDSVAERVLMLDGKPVASLKGFLELATIKEANGNETNEEMINSVISDFTTVINELKEAIKVGQELEDEVSVDLLLGIQSSLEKHVWMLKTTIA